MNIIKKLTLRNLFLNKKRSIVTIIGITLSVALITAVASMVVSFRESLITYEKTCNGDYHYLFYDCYSVRKVLARQQKDQPQIVCFLRDLFRSFVRK